MVGKAKQLEICMRKLEEGRNTPRERTVVGGRSVTERGTVVRGSVLRGEALLRELC